MAINFEQFGKRLAEIGNQQSRRIFILKEGEATTGLFNPHPDIQEPLDSLVHWVDPPGFSIACAVGDERFEDGCPGCINVGRSYPRWLWNFYDTRRFHIMKVGKKREYIKCTKKKKVMCPQCEEGVEAKLNGSVVWETSADISKQIRDFCVEEVYRFCKCGGRLSVIGWKCPACKTKDEDELPALTAKIICPSCEETVTPRLLYTCSSKCEKPKHIELTDAWVKIKRSGKNAYNFSVVRLITDEERESLKEEMKPVDLFEHGKPPSPAEYFRALGRMNPAPQLMAPQQGTQHKQLQAGQAPALDVEFED